MTEIRIGKQLWTKDDILRAEAIKKVISIK